MALEEEETRVPERREEQYTTYSKLKSGEKNDTLTFTLDFLVLRLVFIAVIPQEGFTKAPVYIKFRLRTALEVLRGG
jgi:hypothetical protein